MDELQKVYWTIFFFQICKHYTTNFPLNLMNFVENWKKYRYFIIIRLFLFFFFNDKISQIHRVWFLQNWRKFGLLFLKKRRIFNMFFQFVQSSVCSLVIYPTNLFFPIWYLFFHLILMIHTKTCRLMQTRLPYGKEYVNIKCLWLNLDNPHFFHCQLR